MSSELTRLKGVPPRSRRVTLRLTETQYARIDTIAQLNNLERSEVLRLMLDHGFAAAREDRRARAASR